MALSGSFAKHLTPAYRDIVGTTFQRWPAFYSRFYNVEATNRSYEDYFAATGIPKAATKPEGQPIAFYDPIEGLAKRITISARAIGVQVSRELWDDDLYKNKSAVRKAAQGLAESFAECVEVDGCDPFNSPASYTTVDGVALFSTAHTRLDGGTNQANKPTVDVGLTLTSIRAGLLQFDKWMDDRGNRIRGNPRFLLVPTDLYHRAKELMQSDKKPGTADNDPNVTKGEVEVIRWPYLSSTTAWYIVGSKHQLYWLWRTRPELDSYDDRDKKVAKFTIWGRYGFAPIHWHDLYYSAGA